MAANEKFQYFGRSALWYDQLVTFTQGYLPLVRAHRQEQDSQSGEVPEATIIPAGILDHIKTLKTPEEVFAFLQTGLDEDKTEILEERRFTWLAQFAEQTDEKMAPLIMQALTHSVGSAVKDAAWLGKRVGQIFSEYLVALETIYQASKGEEIEAATLEEAKVHRDAIEFYCYHLFGGDLRLVRDVLARLVPDHFLYRWEVLDSQGRITLKDLQTAKTARVEDEEAAAD